ncbi:MAG TPA: FCD domain-containing protein [Chloroflexota bacterium]|nr:FCD domain-containing protein [Chloroflexota bacterium]
MTDFEPATVGLSDPGVGAAAREPAGLQTAIRRYIVEHGLQPGDRLPSEAELAAALGNSRLIVREALRALDAVGVLESRAGSGWFVRRFDVAAAARIFAQSLAFHHRALLDLLAVRRAAESRLVGTLVGTLAEADLAVLEELADRMRWRAGRGEVFAAEDAEFHRRLLACTGNLVALALADLYLNVVREMYQRGLPRPEGEELPAAAAAHGDIVAALRRGDGAEAARVMDAHHDLSEKRIRAWMERQAGGADAAGAGAVRDAVQAALLWPGPR